MYVFKLYNIVLLTFFLYKLFFFIPHRTRVAACTYIRRRVSWEYLFARQTCARFSFFSSSSSVMCVLRVVYYNVLSKCCSGVRGVSRKKKKKKKKPVKSRAERRSASSFICRRRFSVYFLYFFLLIFFLRLRWVGPLTRAVIYIYIFFGFSNTLCRTVK